MKATRHYIDSSEPSPFLATTWAEIPVGKKYLLVDSSEWIKGGKDFPGIDGSVVVWIEKEKALSV